MERDDRRLQALAIGVIVTGAIALVAVGWAVWIVADPEYWFPDAFAERGDEGPRGDSRAARQARHVLDGFR